MARQLTQAELAKFKDVHPDLLKVLKRFAETTTMDFRVLETVRTVAAQKRNVAKGVSQTMHSRHIPASNKCGLACAMDIAPAVGGKASFAWPLYYKLKPEMLRAAKDVGVPLEWGGDWKRFTDGPHWQLPWKQYP